MEKKATDELFLEAYKKLNTEQRKAVDAIEGTVMVVAGPGTGKTQILALRIANVLRRTDVGAESILALTFTESGARAMRARLRTYIGSDAYRVTISTFHGFAESLIREYPESFGRIIGGRLLTDIEYIDLLEEILESGTYKAIRPAGNPVFYVPHIQNIIKKLKQENVTPDDLGALIAKEEQQLAVMPQVHEKGPHKGKVRSEYHQLEKSIAKNKELAVFYRSYDALCKERRLYDYEDMIMEAVAALRDDESMLRNLEERYLYVLADEHQDVNGVQNEILSLLTTHSEQPNLFVVGDEKQAIYRFQGASLENFLYFENMYPDVETISLTENYRSGQEILDGAHSLITAVKSAADELRVPLNAAGETAAGAITLRSFAHEAVEEASLVDRVADMVERGVPPKEVAVIVRTNKEVERLTALLRKRGLEVLPSADTDILEHPITHTICALMDAVTDRQNETGLSRVISAAYCNISSEDLLRIFSGINYERSLHAIVSDEEILVSLGVRNPASVLKVARVLDDARKKDGIEVPHRILETLLAESGYLEAVLQQYPFEGARVVRRLYDEIEAWVQNATVHTLGDIGRLLSRMREHKVALNAPFIGNQDNAVRVMTAHKSKGLEFEYVFLPHLTDQLWGGRKKPEYFKISTLKHLDETAFDRSDDERRLFYVALTRAKKEVQLSYADASSEGRELMPTRLLEDIDAVCITEVDTETEECTFDPLATVRMRTDVPLHFNTEILQSMFLERGLSVTGLNNYLVSPWTYFYRNMLRLPEFKTTPLLFGDAMHAALEQIYRARMALGAFPDATKIDMFLKKALARLPISTEEYTRLHERGLAALVAYCSKTTLVPSHDALCEFKLRVMLQTGDVALPEIPLTGVIDRLDVDAGGNATRFVDYKTGKPKTRNVIEGNTKNSDGAYKRQLVFYTLLLSLYDDERYTTQCGALSFVEPDAKGKVHEEEFSVTTEEVEELKEEIIRVSKDIVSGAFLREPCDPSVCDYCPLADEFRARLLR